MSAPAVDGPDSAVNRPPPAIPIMSDSAEAKLPPWMLPRLTMLCRAA